MAGSGVAVLAVEHLTKRYDAQVLAVDDLQFSVGLGEVCGLLGPNGAGKTTTLRMLVGLVRPTSGEARLFGERVGPGMPELRRVGALIEGAAFAPYLSGITNLRLWWESNGAHWSDADVEEALAVAGLGAAVERKVRTYSHGMKQRLGIARALLGRPELLVLDEPATGLDPQELREIRRLLRRLSDRGVTILLSSHLLAEVELSCSHVVVMDRGRLVASGSVPELVGAGAKSVYVEVDDPVRARTVLATLPAVRIVTTDADGFTLELDGVDRTEVVAALVHGGVGVRTITARWQLEDAFLGLVGVEHSR